jgi:hypothetical protein
MYYGLLGLAGKVSAPSFTGLLDTYSGAAAAYSAARRLSSTYTGSLIRVRRSSDNTEQDIGYNGSNVLDETALTTFVGAGNGFVTTWYDQSGNGNNVTQSTASYQPKIVNSGSVITLLSKPTIDFSITTGFQQLDFSSGSYTAASAFTVFNRANNISTYGVIYAYAGAAYSFHQPFSNGETYDGFFMTSRLSLGGNMQTAGNYILQQINNGSTLIDYYNSTATNSVSGTFAKSSIYKIAGNADPMYYFSDKMTEHILWLSDKSSDRTGINTNINTYYSIY